MELRTADCSQTRSAGHISTSPITRVSERRQLPAERKRTAQFPVGCSRRESMALRAQMTQQEVVEEYNRTMQTQMGWDKLDPFKYHPERGLYFHEVWPDVLCGSQPRSRDEVDQLAEFLGDRGSILSLQQDKDLAYWQVNLHELQDQAARHSLTYLRRPARDFDPHSLRSTLPGAVRALHRELEAGRRVYVHCTAGLGRAPAVCIAYLYWFQHFQLQNAYEHVTTIRPCGPKWHAIRGATYDLLDGRGWHAFDHLPPISYSELNPTDKHNLRSKLLHS